MKIYGNYSYKIINVWKKNRERKRENERLKWGQSGDETETLPGFTCKSTKWGGPDSGPDSGVAVEFNIL